MNNYRLGVSSIMKSNKYFSIINIEELFQNLSKIIKIGSLFLKSLELMPELDLHPYMGVENSDFLIPKEQCGASLLCSFSGKKCPYSTQLNRRTELNINVKTAASSPNT